MLTMAQKAGTIQIGDTTYYKSLIPETKQSLLKNISMIANMQFCVAKRICRWRIYTDTVSE